MIVFQNINKTFYVKEKQIQALIDINLSIEKQDIFGIIGFSGAGKSTLLRCINHLEKPTSGKLFVQSNDISNMKDAQIRKVRKKIGMIFQQFNLMKSRTVYDNIAFPMKGMNLSNEEKNKKIIHLLQLVDLEEKKDAYPSQLSGGQKQRVAIARALANDPEILLCDEATSALDPQTTKSILQLLKKVNQKFGITIVLITHEMEVIKEICNKVAVMEKGRIVEQGEVVTVFSNPTQTITKEFLASSSSFTKMIENLYENNKAITLKENEQLLRLQYNDKMATQAIISQISRKFNIDCSILFANIEYIQTYPFGDLIILIQGEKQDREKALQYVEGQDIQVEVIQLC